MEKILTDAHLSTPLRVVFRKPCQRSKMERFAKIVKGIQPLTIFAKHSILDVCQCSEYASTTSLHLFRLN